MATASDRIDHVVVLMLENRSFDHMLGYLDHPRKEFDGLRETSHFNNRSSDRTRVYANNDGKPFGVDPDHSHEAALVQKGEFDEVKYNGGFVKNYEDRLASFGDHRSEWAVRASGGDVMASLDPPSHCRILAELALQFAVSDVWFSSLPGETWPNRNFAHAATSDSTVDNELGFYYDDTIFELIARKGATWRIYYDGPPQVWCFPRLWRRTLLDLLLRRESKIRNWYPAPEFFKHVEHGDLPNYAFIEPAHNRYGDSTRRTNSQHPGNNLGDGQDFYAGDALIQDLYQALLRQPSLFSKTLLVIVYDEQGGLYDHARSPCGVAPGDPVHRGVTRRIGRWLRALLNALRHSVPDQPVDFTELGVRVPAVLVSPWIEPNTILRPTDDRHFDHSSIPATLRALFAAGLPPLTSRDANAATFHHSVETVRTSPRPNPRDPHRIASAGAEVLLPDFDPDDTRDPLALRNRTDAEMSKDEPTEFDEQLIAHAERVRQSLLRDPRAPADSPGRRSLNAFRRLLQPRTRWDRSVAATDPVNLFAREADAARRSTVRSNQPD
jgi:phospholipase C